MSGYWFYLFKKDDYDIEIPNTCMLEHAATDEDVKLLAKYDELYDHPISHMFSDDKEDLLCVKWDVKGTVFVASIWDLSIYTLDYINIFLTSFLSVMRSPELEKDRIRGYEINIDGLSFNYAGGEVVCPSDYMHIIKFFDTNFYGCEVIIDNKSYLDRKGKQIALLDNDVERRLATYNIVYANIIECLCAISDSSWKFKRLEYRALDVIFTSIVGDNDNHIWELNADSMEFRLLNAILEKNYRFTAITIENLIGSPFDALIHLKDRKPGDLDKYSRLRKFTIRNHKQRSNYTNEHKQRVEDFVYRYLSLNCKHITHIFLPVNIGMKILEKIINGSLLWPMLTSFRVIRGISDPDTIYSDMAQTTPLRQESYNRFPSLIDLVVESYANKNKKIANDIAEVRYIKFNQNNMELAKTNKSYYPDIALMIHGNKKNRRGAKAWLILSKRYRICGFLIPEGVRELITKALIFSGATTDVTIDDIIVGENLWAKYRNENNMVIPCITPKHIFIWEEMTRVRNQLKSINKSMDIYDELIKKNIEESEILRQSLDITESSNKTILQLQSQLREIDAIKTESEEIMIGLKCDMVELITPLLHESDEKSEFTTKRQKIEEDN